VRQAEQVTVEFYGIPRQRAGRAELAVAARTMAELLTEVARECPRLELCDGAGRLAAHYLLSLNGRRFVHDPGQPLAPGDQVLILSADVGG